ncbi:MAG: hypothetical protein D6733_04450 [Methanobacteriota archaeon]|nr:MAG: hypothetical protein D6733_04450 [Euryarchaeota archaeon]
MALNVRLITLIGVLLFLFTAYYLEKQYEKGEIFWIYSLLSALFGVFSAYTVVAEHPSKQYFIPLTVVTVVMAILYYQADEPEGAATEPG